MQCQTKQIFWSDTETKRCISVPSHIYVSILMYSALLPVGQGHLPTMNDSLRGRSHAERGPMGGRIERRDYSSKLKIAGTRMGFLTIPVHLPCPPPHPPYSHNPPSARLPPPPPLVRARGEEGEGPARMLTHGPEEREREWRERGDQPGREGKRGSNTSHSRDISC